MHLHHIGCFIAYSCVLTQCTGSVTYSTPFSNKSKTVHVYDVPRANTVHSYQS